MENKTNIGMFTWTDFKGAIVSGLLTAVLTMGVYIVQIGNIFEINVHNLVNIGAMAGITSIVSLLKSSLTNQNGKFLGTVEVK